jgi:hypothetical protein
MKCKECQLILRKDNKTGFCVKHRNLADSIIEYKRNYYNKNKERLNKLSINNYFSNKKLIEARNCFNCKSKFQPTRNDNKFCSSKCGMHYWLKII